jgi:hypothetical protein
MSHFTVVVIGDDIESQLAPYEETEVAPYMCIMDEDEIRGMKEYYDKTTGGISLEELAEKMLDWNNTKGHYDNGKLYYFSTYNPESQWDWYEVGGRWRGYFLGLDGHVYDEMCKGEVDFEGMLKSEDFSPIPYAIVYDGKWLSKGKMGWFGASRDTVSEEDWERKVMAIYESLPDATMMTMVDCHI